MELCGVMTLGRMASEMPDKKFSEKEAAKIFVPLVQAVDYLHAEGIYHRDLKLSNILVGDQGTVKLIDYGFAENSGQKLKEYCGTLSYMAPELITRNPYYGKYVDSWALGVILYRIVTGLFPFGSSLAFIYRGF